MLVSVNGVYSTLHLEQGKGRPHPPVPSPTLLLRPTWGAAVWKPTHRGVEHRYEVSQGCMRHSPAVALFSGTISSMGRRKWVKWAASSWAQPYFSTSTSNNDQGFSLVMCLSSPADGSTQKQVETRVKVNGVKANNKTKAITERLNSGKCHIFTLTIHHREKHKPLVKQKLPVI